MSTDMPLIPTIPQTGLPGMVVDTAPWYAESVQYTANQVAQTYTLNLNAVPLIAYGNYTISVDGSATTLVFNPGTSLLMSDFTSQMAQHISRFGYFWASITAPGILTLTARQAGINYQVSLGDGLTAATLTQTIAPSTPAPLTAGTLVYWNRAYNNDPRSHRQVTTYNIASGVAGFDAVRDIAGIVLRDLSNYQAQDTVPSTYLEVLRQGHIWVRNYGSGPVTRDTPVLINSLAGTSSLPSGSFGVGIPVSQPTLIQYDSYAAPSGVVKVRLNLP